MGHTKILVVEDEPLILRTIADRLASEGHDVFQAENGRAALRLLEKQEVDVVVTDVVMPEIDGIELILELRKSEPDVGVICMSAYDSVYLDVTHQLGAVRVLVKPFEWGELQEAVGAALESGRSSRAKPPCRVGEAVALEAAS